jgi:MFS family permease
VNILLPTIGTVFEYCDVCLYMVYAKDIARDLLAAESPLVVYMIQFLAALSRPLGAYLFGLLGDARGANTALRHSVFGMIGLTFLIASIPSHSVIGVWAGVAYITLRTLQMAVCGGELNFAAIALMSSMRYKNLASGIAWSATSVGWLMANAMGCITRDWRMAFLMTGTFGLMGALLRIYLASRVCSVPLPIVDTPNPHPRGNWIVFALSSSIASFTYYTQQYCPLHVDVYWLLGIYALSAVMNVVAGYLGDVYDRAWLMRCGVYASFCVSVGLGCGWVSALFVSCVYPVTLALWKAPMHALAQKVVDPAYRCSQSATFYALGTAITGQGTMFFCSLLDRWWFGLSVIWPMCGLLLMLHTLKMLHKNYDKIVGYEV